MLSKVVAKEHLEVLRIDGGTECAALILEETVIFLEGSGSVMLATYGLHIYHDHRVQDPY
jgi:hypothetical protein